MRFRPRRARASLVLWSLPALLVPAKVTAQTPSPLALSAPPNGTARGELDRAAASAIGGRTHVFGPFPVRSADSLSLLFYQALPESAGTLGRGRWEIRSGLLYASLGSRSSGKRFTVRRDGEILRWELEGRYGLTDTLDIGIRIPFTYASSGFLDSFIEDFHDVTGLGAVGDAKGLYEDEILFRGRRIHGLREDEFGLGDLSLEAKWALVEDEPGSLGVAVRAGLELPTGSVSRGFGSGGVDGGAGLVLQKSWGDFTLFGAVDGAFQSNPHRFEKAGAEVKPAVVTASLGAEWRFADGFALGAQLDYGEPLLEGGDAQELERDRLLVTFGLHVQPAPGLDVSLAMIEDAILDSVPDVTFFLGVRVRG